MTKKYSKMAKAKTKKTTKVTKKSQVIFERKSQKKRKPAESKKSDKDTKPAHRLLIKSKPNFKPWLRNRTKAIRKLSKHRAARALNHVGFRVKQAARFGAPAGVALVILLALVSLFSPKNDFEKAKEQLAKNQNDFEAHLILAEEFLKNNQFQEAERMLLLAQRDYELRIMNNELGNKTLGEQANVKLGELWERKRYSDPEDIRRLIATWEKILKEKPGYRDGHFQLAILYYKIYKDKKSKEHLGRAIEIDPNYELAREFEKVISDK